MPADGAAGRVEEFREQEGLNKSQAVRELVQAGLVEHERVEGFRHREGMDKREAVRALVRSGFRDQDRKQRLYERSALVGLGVLFAAGFVVLASMALGLAAAAADQLGGVGALTVLFVGLGTLALLALAVLIGAVMHYGGFFQWTDRKIDRLRSVLGVEP